MSGHWPPSWYDPDDNFPGEAGQQDAAAETGLYEVTAYLASVPAPLMPGSVEARISAALAVEAAARAGLAAPGDGTAKAEEKAQAPGSAGPQVLSPVPAHTAAARARAVARMQRRDGRKRLGQFVLGPLAVCLLLVVIGFGLSRAGSNSSSSSAGSAAGAAPVASASASASASDGQYEAAGSSAASAPRAVTPAAAGTSAGLVVSETGTRYQQATLAQQVRAQVTAAKGRQPVPSAAPTAGSSSSGAAAGGGSVTALAGQLRACVLQVTGGVLPELVDLATYQGTPAYVIATASRVWVVGLGCTAARPQVITSVALAG